MTEARRGAVPEGLSADDAVNLIAELGKSLAEQATKGIGWGQSTIEITWEAKRVKVIRSSHQETYNFRDKR
jgi:hypothetical protein